MAKRGRKSLVQELQIVEYLAELQPKFFKVLKEALDSNLKGDKHWAAEQLTKLYAKAVPQKIGGDPNNDTPIQIKLLGGITQNGIQGNNSDKQDTSLTKKA